MQGQFRRALSNYSIISKYLQVWKTKFWVKLYLLFICNYLFLFHTYELTISPFPIPDLIHIYIYAAYSCPPYVLSNFAQVLQIIFPSCAKNLKKTTLMGILV